MARGGDIGSVSRLLTFTRHGEGGEHTVELDVLKVMFYVLIKSGMASRITIRRTLHRVAQSERIPEAVRSLSV